MKKSDLYLMELHVNIDRRLKQEYGHSPYNKRYRANRLKRGKRNKEE